MRSRRRHRWLAPGALRKAHPPCQSVSAAHTRRARDCSDRPPDRGAAARRGRPGAATEAETPSPRHALPPIIRRGAACALAGRRMHVRPGPVRAAQSNAARALKSRRASSATRTNRAVVATGSPGLMAESGRLLTRPSHRIAGYRMRGRVYIAFSDVDRGTSTTPARARARARCPGPSGLHGV